MLWTKPLDCHKHLVFANNPVCWKIKKNKKFEIQQLKNDKDEKPNRLIETLLKCFIFFNFLQLKNYLCFLIKT